MRLIDRDELLMHLADYQLQESPDWGANGYGNKEKYEAITECIRAVEEAPTIDPVKHGHWIISVGEYARPYGTYCSECGWSWASGIDAVKLNLVLSKIETNFCPNCGAKMDEVEE